MERVVVNRSFTLSQTFYSDGVAVAPTGTPTVTITRLSTGATVTTGSVSGTSTGPYTVTVPASANTLLDTLNVTWTATISGEAQPYTDTVEVAGGFLFSIAQARAVDALSKTDNSGNYRIATADLVAMRTIVEQTLEDAFDVAFVPRYARQTLIPHNYPASLSPFSLMLRPKIRAIRSLSVGGSAYSTDQLAGLIPDFDNGVLPLYSPLTGYAPSVSYAMNPTIVVGYEHGYDSPPGRITVAALALTKRWLAGTPADDRATSVSTAEETTTLYVPGQGDIFDVPEVLMAMRQYNLNAEVY